MTIANDTYNHWACLDCLACHVSHDADPTHFNAAGREHIAQTGHRIEGKKVVNGVVEAAGVWGGRIQLQCVPR